MNKYDITIGNMTDDEIDKLTPIEAWDRWLTWEGIIGYSNVLHNLHERIFNNENI